MKLQRHNLKKHWLTAVIPIELVKGVEMGLYVLKKFMLSRKFGVSFEVVGRLHKIMTQPLKLNTLRCRRPPKMIMILLLIPHLMPNERPFRTPFNENSLNKILIIAGEDLKLMNRYILVQLLREGRYHDRIDGGKFGLRKLFHRLLFLRCDQLYGFLVRCE